MLINKEWIDKICPKHGRTSCNDKEIYNGFGGWNGKYDVDTGAKIIKYPRCNRCYLLDNIGMDTEDLEFEIYTETTLSYKIKSER
jgi:hypothetical protein